MKHTLPKLPYAYNALEPFIDEETSHYHHDKHHQGYVDKLNIALEKYPNLTEKPLDEILKNLNEVPEEIRTAVINNGGGHYAHTLFWEIMSPKPVKNPSGDLLNALKINFGSLEEFKKLFSQKAVGLFGSGWVWLVKRVEKLEIVETQGHDVPISQDLTPIMVIDVWEHAYYLKYKNDRAAFIKNWWNVLDWSKVKY